MKRTPGVEPTEYPDPPKRSELRTPKHTIEQVVKRLSEYEYVRTREYDSDSFGHRIFMECPMARTPDSVVATITEPRIFFPDVKPDYSIEFSIRASFRQTYERSVSIRTDWDSIFVPGSKTMINIWDELRKVWRVWHETT